MAIDKARAFFRARNNATTAEDSGSRRLSQRDRRATLRVPRREKGGTVVPATPRSAIGELIGRPVLGKTD
jgi:hypothetical protein